MLQEVIKLLEDEDVPACLHISRAECETGSWHCITQECTLHHDEAPKLRVCNRCCFKGLEITEGKKRVRGDGHSERGGMLLKGMYSSSSSEIFFHLLSLDVCLCVHVCMCTEILADWEIVFCFEENNTVS